MDFTRLRALTSMNTLLNKGILNVIENTILRTNLDAVQRYIPAQLLFSIMWGFGGSMALREREAFSKYICTLSNIPTPDQSGTPLLDYSIKFEDNCSWRLWSTYVAKVEVSVPLTLVATLTIALDRNSQGFKPRCRYSHHRHNSTCWSTQKLVVRAQTSHSLRSSWIWQNNDFRRYTTGSTWFGACLAELFQCHFPRTYLEDLWAPLRVQKNSQGHCSTPDSNGEMVGCILRRNQLACRW